MTPTPSQIKLWATTPIGITHTETRDKEGNVSRKSEWQRKKSGTTITEILEGLPNLKWILERKPKTTNSYQLVSVEEIQS